jgi:hypothetical protein
VKNGDQTTKVFLRRVDSLPKRSADAPLPPFEVAAVKPAPPPVGGYNSSMSTNPGRLTATNVMIQKLMARAYTMKDYEIAGPEWLNTELVQLKTGAKLKPVELGKGSTSMRPGQLTATAVPIYNFADIMSRYAVQEQLGLKSNSHKAPIEILVVDRAEKVPTGS